MAINPYLLPMALYAAPFLLVAFLPEWRSLLIAGALIGLPFAWAIWDINAALNDFENDPGVAATLTLAFLLMIGAGLVSGLLVRAGTLLLRRKYRSVRVMLAATLAGFFVTPSGYAGLMWWEDWTRRPPSAACLASTFRVRIADATLSIPPAPVLAVVTGADDRKGVYYFGIPSRLRAFCGLAASSSFPVRASALHIRFEDMKRSHDFLVRAHCQAPAAWIAPLCQKDPLAYARFPVDMSLYAPHEYDHRHMLASETHENFLRARRSAEASGKPLGAVKVGNFDVYSERYWVAREGPWVSRLKEPLTLACYESRPTGLYCSATHEAAFGTQVTYEFRTPRDSVEATVSTIEETIARIISDLANP